MHGRPYPDLKAGVCGLLRSRYTSAVIFNPHRERTAMRFPHFPSVMLGVALIATGAIVACHQASPVDFHPAPALVVPKTTGADVQAPIDGAAKSTAAAQAAATETGTHVAVAQVHVQAAHDTSTEAPVKDQTKQALDALASATTSLAIAEARMTDITAQLAAATTKNTTLSAENQRFLTDALAQQTSLNKQLSDAATAYAAAQKTIADLQDAARQAEAKAKLAADKVESQWWAGNAHLLFLAAFALGAGVVAVLYFLSLSGPLAAKLSKGLGLAAGICLLVGFGCEGIAMHIDLVGEISIATVGLCVLLAAGFVAYELVGAKKVAAAAHALELKAADEAHALALKVRDAADAEWDKIHDATAAELAKAKDAGQDLAETVAEVVQNPNLGGKGVLNLADSATSLHFTSNLTDDAKALFQAALAKQQPLVPLVAPVPVAVQAALSVPKP